MEVIVEEVDSASANTMNQENSGADTAGVSNQPVGPTPAGPRPSATWAARSTAKPHTLKVHLVKNGEDDNVKMTLTPAEKGRLVRKLGIPKGKLMAFCDAKLGTCVLKVSEDVKLAQLNLADSIPVKTGLRTKPVAPVVKEKLIKLFWTSLETSNEKIKEVMSRFGRVTSDIQYQTYKAGKDATEDELYLEGTVKGDRFFYMKVVTPIPGYIVIDGKRVKCYYSDQIKTCPRCYQTKFDCPGKANKTECEKAGEEQRDIFELWEQYEESSDTDDDETIDFLELANLPPNVAKSDLLRWILEKCAVDVDEHQLTQVSDTIWRLEKLLVKEVKCLFWMGNDEKVFFNGEWSEGRVKMTKCLNQSVNETPEKTPVQFEPESEEAKKEQERLEAQMRAEASEPGTAGAGGSGDGHGGGEVDSGGESGDDDSFESSDDVTPVSTPANKSTSKLKLNVQRTTGGTIKTASVIGDGEVTKIANEYAAAAKIYAEIEDKSSKEAEDAERNMTELKEQLDEAKKKRKEWTQVGGKGGSKRSKEVASPGSTENEGDNKKKKGTGKNQKQQSPVAKAIQSSLFNQGQVPQIRRSGRGNSGAK